MPQCVRMQVEAFADAGQHAKRQHVDLHQPECVDIVLVPFDEGALVHRGVADRHDLVEPSARQHETADMLGEMAREIREACRQDRWPCRGAGSSDRARPRAPAGELLSSPQLPQTVPAIRAVTSSVRPKHLADLADGAARAVVDDRGGDAGALAAIAFVDVLDHLLAPFMLEIDVDIGRLLALRRDEAGKQQFVSRPDRRR